MWQLIDHLGTALSRKSMCSLPQPASTGTSINSQCLQPVWPVGHPARTRSLPEHELIRLETRNTVHCYSPHTVCIAASPCWRSLQTKCSISAKPHSTAENNHHSFSIYSQHFSIFPKPSFSSNNSVFVGQLPSEDWEAHEGGLVLLGQVSSWETWSSERSCSSLDINDHVLHVPWNHSRALRQLGKNCQGWNVHKIFRAESSKPIHLSFSNQLLNMECCHMLNVTSVHHESFRRMTCRD